MKRLTIHNSNLYDIIHVYIWSYDDISYRNSVVLNNRMFDDHHPIYVTYLALVSPPIFIYSGALKHIISKFLKHSFKSISSQKAK